MKDISTSVEQSKPAITNREFVEHFFDQLPEGALPVVCSFPGDPDNGRWGESPVGPRMNPKALMAEDENTYMCVGSFTRSLGKKKDGSQSTRGRYHRQATSFAGLHAVMIDDLGTGLGAKLDPAKLQLTPTALVETSPDNYQAWLKLKEPITDLVMASKLISALISQGLDAEKDPGMNSVTRYGRMPNGINGKAKYGGWNVRLTEWNPDSAYTLEEIATAFGLDLDTVSAPQKPAHFDSADVAPDDDLAFHALGKATRIKGDATTDEWIVITCPWVDDHTDQLDDDGAKYKLGGGFNCHHGACADRKPADLMAWLETKVPGFDAERDHYEKKKDRDASVAMDNVAQLVSALAGMHAPAEGFFSIPASISTVPEQERPVEPFTVTRIGMDWFTSEPPPERFVIESYIPRRAVTLLVAAGGVGKSLFALYMSAQGCSGEAFLGCEVFDNKIAYISLEDDEAKVRARLYRTVEIEQRQAVIDNLYLVDRYGKETHVVEGANGDVKISKVPGQIVSALAEYRPDMVIVDTLVRSHSVNENDNAQMSAVIGAYEKIAADLDCAVVVLHHVAKGEIGKSLKEAFSHLGRGAGAITDNARSAMVLMPASEKDVKGLIFDNPPAVKEGRIIAVVHAKHNYSRKEDVKWLEMSLDGCIRETTPSTDTRSEEVQHYDHIYKWWSTTWGRKPFCEANVRTAYQSIRPEGANIGERKYRASLEWAVNAAHAIPADVDTTNTNPNAKYYTLKPMLSGDLDAA